MRAKGTAHEDPAASPQAWVEVEGFRLPAWVEQGQVRVELPFDVDFVRLAEMLRQDGYFYAHDPERVDAQGWGRPMDREGYYPYWVFREGGSGGRPARTLFACPPEDYRPAGTPRKPERGRADVEVAAEPGGIEPVIGPAAVAEIRRWVPYLRRAAAPAPRPPRGVLYSGRM